MNETVVFTFDAGGRKRHADPFDVLDRLHLGCAEIDRDFDELCRQSDQRDGAGNLDAVATFEPRAILRHVAREVFGLPEVNAETGDGYTSAVVDRVLDEFLAFAQQKKN